MFFSFYLVKNLGIANNSIAAEAKEKIRTDFVILQFFWCMNFQRQCYFIFKKHQFPVATKDQR
jgi:hypothetical protein